ncbi:MAG: hypothetical protein K0S29_193 [Gammaproteobacteria bacterium]|jgi:lysophospholipid acyltransferase (LPLAT)-like uncharacterized protein|nr:hypothetical protein [Gammaproteobacteria bacterium]
MSLRFFSRSSRIVPSQSTEQARAAQRPGIFHSAATFFSNLFKIDPAMYTSEAELMSTISRTRQGEDDTALVSRGFGVIGNTGSSESSSAYSSEEAHSNSR